MGKKSRTLAAGAANGGRVGEKQARLKLTDKQIKDIKERLQKASTLDEISRLEKMLNEGNIPIDDDRMEE